jgi:hypothetical protein
MTSTNIYQSKVILNYLKYIASTLLVCLYAQNAISANLEESNWFGDMHYYSYSEPSAGVQDNSRLPAITLGYKNNQGLRIADNSKKITGNYEVSLIPTRYTGSGTSDSYYSKFLAEIYTPIRNTTYIGLGYRNLYDHFGFGTTSTGYAGYDRLSQYIYLPVGAYYTTTNGVFKTQMNLLLRGKQTSYLSQISGYKNNIQNTQKNGYGFDFSYIPNTAKWEIYWRYWEIGSSDTSASYYSTGALNGYYLEPANKTNEFGMRFAF